jgi:hypothetical protein
VGNYHAGKNAYELANQIAAIRVDLSRPLHRQRQGNGNGE